MTKTKKKTKAKKRIVTGTKTIKDDIKRLRKTVAKLKTTVAEQKRTMELLQESISELRYITNPHYIA